MKKGIIIAIVLLGLSCSTTIGITNGKIVFPNTITFQGTTYHKVWEDSQPLRLAAEYIPAGQVLDSWEEMITIHYDNFDQISSLNLFFEKTEGAHLFKPEVFKGKDDENIIVDALLYNIAIDSLEQNIILFIPVNQGEHTLKFFVQKRRSLKLYNPSANQELFVATFDKPRLGVLQNISDLDPKLP
jgi:hypothetical protein